MESAPPPVLVRVNGYSYSSSSQSVDEEENVTYDLGMYLRGKFASSWNYSEMTVACFKMVFVLWFLGWIFMWVGVYGPQYVRIGPNSSILVEPNPFIVGSVKVELLDDSKPGLQLFGISRAPPLDVYANWSESRLFSVSRNSYKGCPYYLNKGTSLNISYTVEPQGYAVQLVVKKGKQSISGLLNDPALRDTAWSWNLIQGSGMIDLEINEASMYYVAVANLKRKDVKVEVNIDVKTVLYDTKKSFYNCTFSNGECTFDAMPLIRQSVVVLTSPPLTQGASIEDEEWIVRFSYESRWFVCIYFTVILIGLMLGVMQSCDEFQCGDEARYVSENDSARTRLLANKDDDCTSVGSCNESLANYDADLEENDGATSSSSRRGCTICYDAPRNCFFVPCGHCASCYRCGKRIAKAARRCPICRQRIYKVKKIYTV